MSFWRTSLKVLLATLLWALALEAAARFGIERWGNPFQKSLSLLRADVELAWRQRSDLSTSFFDTKVRTDDEGFRGARSVSELAARDDLIVTLGPSSAFGWGVDNDQTYAYRAGELLGLTSLNLGQIGYSSEQGVRLPRLHDLRPRVLVISYGINDVDRFRFFFPSPRPDAEELARSRSPGVVSYLNFLNSSAFLRVVNERVSALRLSFDCQALAVEPVRRVPLEATLATFRLLTEMYQSKGATVVWVTTPHRFPGLQEEGVPLDYPTLYRETIAAARVGECGRAKFELAKAREGEKHVIARETRELNRALRAGAERAGALLVDAEILLDTGESFVDPIHPSASGHEVLAARLASFVRNRWAQGE